MIGIYRILNLVNNKQYIGSSKNIKIRIRTHFYKLRKNSHESAKLQNAVNKYGLDNFKFETVEECLPDQCLEREQWYLDNWRPEYNIRSLASSNLGFKHSLETKLKIKLGHLGKKKPALTEQHKRQISIRHMGSRKGSCSIEHKLKIKAALTGRSLSIETKNKMSIMKQGKKNPMFGLKRGLMRDSKGKFMSRILKELNFNDEIENEDEPVIPTSKFSELAYRWSLPARLEDDGTFTVTLNNITQPYDEAPGIGDS